MAAAAPGGTVPPAGGKGAAGGSVPSSSLTSTGQRSHDPRFDPPARVAKGGECVARLARAVRVRTARTVRLVRQPADRCALLRGRLLLLHAPWQSYHCHRVPLGIELTERGWLDGHGIEPEPVEPASVVHRR